MSRALVADGGLRQHLHLHMHLAGLRGGEGAPTTAPTPATAIRSDGAARVPAATVAGRA